MGRSSPSTVATPPVSTPAPAGTTTVAAATVPLDPQARTVAREFVATAVSRRDLARAWQLSGPELRQNLTLAEWRTGNIPVTPYPAGRAIAKWKVQSSHPGTALLEVDFTPRKASAAAAASFLIGLRRIGDAWRVATWAPRTLLGPH